MAWLALHRLAQPGNSVKLVTAARETIPDLVFMFCDRVPLLNVARWCVIRLCGLGTRDRDNARKLRLGSQRIARVSETIVRVARVWERYAPCFRPYDLDPLHGQPHLNNG